MALVSFVFRLFPSEAGEPLILDQDRKFFGTAFAHSDRANEALLGADGASDAQGGVGMWITFIIQFDRQIWTARAVTARSAQLGIEFRQFLYWGK